MPFTDKFFQRLFSVNSDQNFNELALLIFQVQYKHNPVYQAFVRQLGVNPGQVNHYRQIPFLPIELFKSQFILTGDKPPEISFYSSGTTGEKRSRHPVSSTSLYIQSFMNSFGIFYGDPEEYIILALLPSYLEQQHSSLVFMANELITRSKHPLSGFYLHNYKSLFLTLLKAEKERRKTLLLGVSFALLKLAEEYPVCLPDLIIVETGGMKGRREELTREELHRKLSAAMGVPAIHSEYGMTELLSQAWSSGNGLFQPPPWMKILIRDSEDPITLINPGITGGINVIDLANLYSCSFIATQDLGKVNEKGSFEVLGRFDASDIRGCNLMVL
ncbi:MAG: acyl transferase [Bacteroidetes bacterium]|nr:acyl transferase [Bacteroidota bacterium]